MRHARPWLNAVLGLALAGAAVVPDLAHARNVYDANHPDLKWYSIETEHFVVHYPKSRKKEGNRNYLTTEWTAKKTAKVAEEMWPRMCAEFNYYLKERIHIVVLNQADDLEGFTVPPWDWIEISANPGGDFYRMRGRMDWLPDVLVHEFAHVVSLKAQATFAEGTQAVNVGGLYSEGVGNTASAADLYIMDDEPFFWTEGGAEYWSDQAGYNWWTPSRDQMIRASVLEDRLLTDEEWLTRVQALRGWDGERGYQQGYSFALYLRQRFGNETYTRFAHENAKGWKIEWTKNIEKVTGVPYAQLYADWRAYITQKYTEQYDRVKAEGEVAGKEIGFSDLDWEYTDPTGRDAFYDPRWKRKWGVTGPEIARIEREKAKEATGRWQIAPRMSDDGKWLGASNAGVVQLFPLGDGSVDAFTGEASTDRGVADALKYRSATVPSYFMDHWDFVPGQDALVVGNERRSIRTPFSTLTGLWVDVDGYRHQKQLYYWPIGVGEQKEGNLVYQGVKPKKITNHERPPKGARPIPNTDRGAQPNVSPDGMRVAYFEYTDGVLNVATINLDGTDKKLLTTFDDGTWMQNLDWSPDGKQLVVSVFRNFQQDLYLMDADGGNVHALTWDRWEKQDPYWGKDGRIYFSADPSGIFNIYALDPASKRVTQITNTIGGAEYPTLSPDGNLLYIQFTGHGFKVYGVPREDFLERDATSLFGLSPDEAAVAASWSFREDLSAWKPSAYTAPPMAPSGLPLLRITNSSRDDVQVQAGAVAFVQDFAEQHFAVVQALVGSDTQILGQYVYQGWYPNIMLSAMYATFKYPYGFLIDDDDDTSTTADQSTVEGKNQQAYALGSVSVEYPWNDRWRSFLYGRGLGISFRGVGDAAWAPYLANLEGGFETVFSNLGQYSFSANPRGGRLIDVQLAQAYTDIVYPDYDGHTVDDGELLDAYAYQRIQARWTEQIPVPGWGFLKGAHDNRHTIQIDTQLGYVTRNVDRFDEFLAGGQHPYYWGSNSLQPNTTFAGYPAYSLSGETMAMINLAYRFPIRRELNKKIGPLFLYDITAQIFGSAGNIWSYKPPSDPGTYYFDAYDQAVAYDASDVKREIPFVDVAHKNGNYLLYDAGVEVRVSSSLFNNIGWNSFARVAYGFNRITGVGDVDGDDVQNTTDNGIGNGLSNEVEEPGFRFYLGLGTGW